MPNLSDTYDILNRGGIYPILNDIYKAASVLNVKGQLVLRTGTDTLARVELNTLGEEIINITDRLYKSWHAYRNDKSVRRKRVERPDPYYVEKCVILHLDPSLIHPKENLAKLSEIYNMYMSTQEKMALEEIKNNALSNPTALKDAMKQVTRRNSRNIHFIMNIANYFGEVKNLSFRKAIVETKKLTIEGKASTYLTEVENRDLLAEIKAREIISVQTDYAFNELRLDAIEILLEGMPVKSPSPYYIKGDAYYIIGLSEGNDQEEIVRAGMTAKYSTEELIKSEAIIDKVVHRIVCRQAERNLLEQKNIVPHMFHRHAGETQDNPDDCSDLYPKAVSSSSSSSLTGLAATATGLAKSSADAITTALSSSYATGLVKSSSEAIVTALTSSLLLTSSSTGNDNNVVNTAVVNDEGVSNIAKVAMLLAATGVAAIAAYTNRSAIKSWSLFNNSSKKSELRIQRKDSGTDSERDLERQPLTSKFKK